jgi:tetratricopeptide (TPR) repeat protein
LEPTRAYALEQLAAAGESAAYLRRHAEAMIEAMSAYHAKRWTAPIHERLHDLAELGNVRAAADWAMRPEGDRRLAIALMSRAWFQWIGNSLWTECLARLLALWPLPPDLPAEEEALFCLALASTRGGTERDEVLQAARRAVALYRSLGDRDMLADALMRLGVIGCARTDVEETDAAIAEATMLIGPAAPARKRASLAMTQGLRALDQRRFADAIDAYRRQAACSREEGSEFGENLALANAAMVSLDMGEVDSAVETFERVVAVLHRMRAPYGLGNIRALLTLARALKGDDADALANAREAYHALLTIGPTSCDKPLMAAAMFHARRGDLRRAALIAACVEGPNVRGTKHICPMDERLDADVARVVAALPAAERVRCREIGARLTLAQVASIALDGARIDAG